MSTSTPMDVDNHQNLRTSASRSTKRPREAGDGSTSGAPPAKRAAAPAAAPAPVPPVPVIPTASEWMRNVQRQSVLFRVPPLAVLEGMEAIRDSTLSGFDRNLSSLQKALVAGIRFDQASENGAVPSLISNAMKLPAPQLLKDTPSLDEVEAVAAAREKAVSDLSTTCTSTSAYMRTIFEAQVARYRAATVVETCATSYADELTSYVKDIILRREGPEGDVHIWDNCIAFLRSEAVLDLQNLGYNYTAKLRKEELEKEAKATTISIARAEAEIANAARTVEELVKDATAAAETRIQELEKRLQQLSVPRRSASRPPRKTATGPSKPAPAKANAKRSNGPPVAAVAAGSSTTTAATEKKTQWKGKGKPARKSGA
ncbi:hypothetical protein R3P38DRAFT_3376885 [Favolaschia claudopus]|uniref:Uncharacterized protein n=1 Tax=Favolaschia claudopus TaxID=2862362 RepID=A0AAV9ZD73_9AGAR